jgi:tetratricopeptide (TPR) repeat protein
MALRAPAPDMTSPAPPAASATSPAPAPDHHTPAWLARLPWWADLVLVAAAALLAHAGMLWGDFIYDDTLVCFAEIARRGDGLFLIFSPTDYYEVGAGEASWRPVATFTHWLDGQTFRLTGVNPLWPRIENWLLHAGAAAMVWKVAMLWRFPRFAAVCAGLLLAVHPLAGESVAIISFREEMLAVIGFGATIWLATAPGAGPGRFVAAGVAAFLTCGAKELGFMLPPLLAAAAWLLPAWPGEPAGGTERQIKVRRAIRWAGPAAAGVLCFAVMRFIVFTPPANFDMGYTGHPGGGGLATGLTMMQIMARYAGMFFLPAGLSVDHTPAVVESLGDWRAWTGLGAMVAMMAFGVRAWRTSPWAALGWTWIVLGLLPVLDVLPLPNIMAERYCYLPLAGAGLLAGWGMQQWLNRRAAAGASGAVVAGCVVVLATAGGIRNLVRAPDWRHDAYLWAAVSRANPESFRALAMYGYVLSHVQFVPQEVQVAYQRVVDAEADIGRPLRRGPEYAAVRDRLGRLLQTADWENSDHRYQLEMARKELEIELRLESTRFAPRWSPEEATNWLNLGIAYYEAGASAKGARRPWENKRDTYITLMRDRQRDGLDLDPVRQQLSRVVDAINALPDPMPYLRQAEEWMLKSVATKRMPLFMRATAYENLSACAGLMEGGGERVEQYAKEAIRLQPTRVYAHYNLAVHYGEVTKDMPPTPEWERLMQVAIDHYRACFHDPRTIELAFRNYFSLMLRKPEYSDGQSEASKALMDEWAAMCDRIPDAVEFRRQLAMRCLMVKLNQRAWDQHRRCLDLDPSWVPGWFNLSALAEEGMDISYQGKGGDPRLALEILREGYAKVGAEHMDKFFDARNQLQRLEARIALPELEAAADKTPGDYAARAQLGRAYVVLNQPKKAIAELREARALDVRRFNADELAPALRAQERILREQAEAARLKKDGTVADKIEAAQFFEARAEMNRAQGWLKMAQEQDPAEYDRLGARKLHTRIQQVIDIAIAAERSAEELGQRATHAAVAGEWPYAVYLWRACRKKDGAVFHDLSGPARLSEADERMRRALKR